MTTLDKIVRHDDPCGQVQADLSAMLDGELDEAAVCRVSLHSEDCAVCRAFFEGIRTQAKAHREVFRALTGDPDDVVEVDGKFIKVAEFRKQLTENRGQLSRIFYELGRGFVLLGLSPNFSRIVSRDPASISDMCQRGKILVDEVAQSGSNKLDGQWKRAQALFETEGVRSPRENLNKGIELLSESLTLDPSFHEARIYLGHAYHVAQRRADACCEFETVLDTAEDLKSRAFALMNLGNVYLETEEYDRAIEYFLACVESGAVRELPQFGVIYFNLALAYGRTDKFQECVDWLTRLYSELPHKRRMVAEEFHAKELFAGILDHNPEIGRRLNDAFPCWFPLNEAC